MNAVSRYAPAGRRLLQGVALLFLLRLLVPWSALLTGDRPAIPTFPWDEVINGLLLIFGLAVYGLLAGWSAALSAKSGAIGPWVGTIGFPDPVANGLDGSALLAQTVVCLFALWGLRRPSEPGSDRPDNPDAIAVAAALAEAGFTRPSAAPVCPDQAVPPPPAR